MRTVNFSFSSSMCEEFISQQTRSRNTARLFDCRQNMSTCFECPDVLLSLCVICVFATLKVKQCWKYDNTGPPHFFYLNEQPRLKCKATHPHINTRSIMQDTEWLLQRMARLTDACSPDDAAAAPGASPATAEALVREAHRSFTGTYWTTHAVNRCSSFQHNPGVGQKTRNSTKRLKSEYLHEACQEWPHLLREVPGAAGRPAKFLRRTLHVDRMQEVIASVCAGNDTHTVADVFGTWDDWKWPEEQPGETSWDSLLQGETSQCSQQIPHVQ